MTNTNNKHQREIDKLEAQMDTQLDQWEATSDHTEADEISGKIKATEIRIARLSCADRRRVCFYEEKEQYQKMRQMNDDRAKVKPSPKPSPKPSYTPIAPTPRVGLFTRIWRFFFGG